MAIVLIVVAGSGIFLSGPASATAYNCSQGTRYNLVQWYAWARCTSGTGYYRVGAGCEFPFPQVLYGPKVRVGGGESRVACPGGFRASSTFVETYS